MKAGKPNVYLSQQALDIMAALRTCASGSLARIPHHAACGEKEPLREFPAALRS